LYIGPQLRAWKSQRANLSDRGVGHAVGPPAYFRDEEFLAILRRYLLDLLKPMVDQLSSDELFIEKTPSHGLYIPEIKQFLPDTRFIHILRDPRDVVASLLGASRTWGASWAPDRPSVAAAMWVQHIQAIHEASKRLSSNDFHELTYEKLWQSSKETLKELARFLNLIWSDDDIKKAIEINQAEAMKFGGTSIPVYGEVAVRMGAVAKLPQGFIRKARPNVWQSDLSLRDKFQVWRVVHRTMEKAGYSWRLREWL
jgi:hypothetical protein